jgi:hypothetical protein
MGEKSKRADGALAVEPSPAAPAVKALLLWFSELERSGGGYQLRGVRGWTLAKEIPERLIRHTDGLPRIAEHRLLDRENIALPGRASPFWLYRINARGAELSGVAAPAEPGAPEEAPPPRMIFTAEQWSALLYMRSAKSEASPARFATRELGWRTIKEIRDGGAVRSIDLQVWAEDVTMLERARLLEKREASGVDRARPIIFYRVTDIGERVQRLEGHSNPGKSEGA